MRDWAEAPLPVEVQTRLARAAARGEVLVEQIAALDGQQQAAVSAAAPASALRQLVQLKGATTRAAVLLAEGLVWRAFRNRRPNRRAPGLCADALRQRGIDARARDQSSGQCAPAACATPS